MPYNRQHSAYFIFFSIRFQFSNKLSAENIDRTSPIPRKDASTNFWWWWFLSATFRRWAMGCWCLVLVPRYYSCLIVVWVFHPLCLLFKWRIVLIASLTMAICWFHAPWVRDPPFVQRKYFFVFCHAPAWIATGWSEQRIWLEFLGETGREAFFCPLCLF